MTSRLVTGTLVALTVAGAIVAPAAAFAATDPCGTGSNPIVCENSKPGTPINDWYSDQSWGDIEGFTTKTSVQPGETLQMKVQSPSAFTVDIYRLGYYGGDGARLMPTSPTATYPAKTQPNCLHDSATGLVDCGNWATNFTWAVPTDAVSGVYLAMLDQGNGSGLMPYPFVVANDSSHSDVLVQTDDETWQAYNLWGGQDLYYGGGPALDGRAYKVSYNRPLSISGDNGVLSTEFPMIEWLERNGYDATYTSGIDVSTKSPTLLQNHKVFMSSGHDEYWNQKQWDAVTAAKTAGVNLAFFSGNEAFWRTRLEPAISTDATANRTLVCYKETKISQTPVNGIPDPSGQWTGTWMDPAGAGKGGNKPQNQLSGTLFTVNGYRADAITVSSAYKNLRLWRSIPQINNLAAGQSVAFQNGTLGYEWDSDVENAARPPGAVAFSSTTVAITDGTLLLDQGNDYGNGTATHNIVEYRDPTSHALVFGAGTVQWAWGLSALHSGTTTVEDAKMQQATLNVLADMGVQPLTKQSNLVAQAKSTDTVGPTVTVTTPASGATVPKGTPLTISGTAADVGGQVGRVEISTDNGTTWKAATGTAAWSYTWAPTTQGAGTIKVRGIDDSLNVGAVTTVNLTVGPQQCPCSTFTANDTPANIDSFDPNPNELGAKFRVTTTAQVLGVKFYKAGANTGTHVGKLWSSSGKLLASGNFTGESASGWQTMTFASPVSIGANTTYIVSYYAPTGHYSYDSSYFTSHGAGDGIVKQLQSGVDGSNGVYNIGTGGGFPTSSWNDTNYWVDAIVQTGGSATTNPATVTATTPAGNATGAALNVSPTATFDHDIDSSTLQFTLKNGSTAVPATVSYNDTTHKATLEPNDALTAGATYTASVKATDVWGNVMPSAYTWTFTTGSVSTCPCSIWSSSAVPDVAAAGEVNNLELGMRFTSSTAGYVTGVRFYKSDTNTGTHTGTLWSNTGTQLATGTFANESSSGWQTLTFATPVAITANTAYVVSYHTTIGHYAYSAGYFTQARTNGPLTAVADSGSGHNGLFTASTGTTFPTSTYNANNYWVDVIFNTTAS
jgi:hypothetical protein